MCKIINNMLNTSIFSGIYEDCEIELKIDLQDYPKYVRAAPISYILHPNIDYDCEEPYVCVNIVDEWSGYADDYKSLDLVVQALVYILHQPEVDDSVNPIGAFVNLNELRIEVNKVKHGGEVPTDWEDFFQFNSFSNIYRGTAEEITKEMSKIEIQDTPSGENETGVDGNNVAVDGDVTMVDENETVVDRIGSETMVDRNEPDVEMNATESAENETVITIEETTNTARDDANADLTIIHTDDRNELSTAPTEVALSMQTVLTCDFNAVTNSQDAIATKEKTEAAAAQLKHFFFNRILSIRSSH